MQIVSLQICTRFIINLECFKVKIVDKDGVRNLPDVKSSAAIAMEAWGRPELECYFSSVNPFEEFVDKEWEESCSLFCLH